MKAATDRYFQNAFVLTSESVQKLVGTVEKLVGSPEFQIECRDGIKREFDETQSFLDFDNSPSKAISTLWILARDREKQSEMRLRFKTEHSPIYFHVAGEERFVSELTESLKDRIDGMTPWYSVITRLNFAMIGFFILVASISGLVLLWLYAALKTAPAPETKTSYHDLAVILIIESSIVLSLLGGGWLLNRVRDFFFPLGTFALGQGVSRHSTYEAFRWVILVGFIISFLGSFAVAILQWLTQH